MILDEITFHDFGLYDGTQSVSLTPPSPNKPIILIGGLNGGGKTTFIDALQLIFFGPHAKCSSRGSLGYQEYLSQCIHRGSYNDEAGLEITFRHTVEGQEENYHLRRFWKRSGSACKEQFEVYKNGQAERSLADNWANQVEDFFPANIAHLFLFDGEQIEAYASQQNSSALIGAAIHNLLGLDMVDQLEKDLLVYERRKRSENKDDSRHIEIAFAQDTLQDLCQRMDTLKQERAALQTHRIDRKRLELRKVEENYRKIGGDLYDQKEIIEGKWSSIVQQINNGEAELRDYAGSAAPLLMIQDLLELTEAHDRHEEECRRARELASALKERDKTSLRFLHDQSADKNIIQALEVYFHADRAQRETLGKKDTILDITPETRSDLHNLLRGDLNRFGNRATELLSQQKKRRDDEKQIRVEYESIPSTDTVEQVTTERDKLMSEITELEAIYAAMGQDLERQQRELERREQLLARLMEADVKAQGHRDDRSRILYHSGKVRETLKVFRHAVIARHVRRVEQMVFESYQQLLRKSGLVTRLSINSEDFSLTLYGRDDELLSTGQLSAGERQLLAIALLWGLAKASGRPLPTAIDTPLGRLDSFHRMHLVERYLPFASHQVLLLSTDEEIAGEYHDCLAPWIGHTYLLNYDDATGATRIAPGYLTSTGTA